MRGYEIISSMDNVPWGYSTLNSSIQYGGYGVRGTALYKYRVLYPLHRRGVVSVTGRAINRALPLRARSHETTRYPRSGNRARRENQKKSILISEGDNRMDAIDYFNDPLDALDAKIEYVVEDPHDMNEMWAIVDKIRKDRDQFLEWIDSTYRPNFPSIEKYVPHDRESMLAQVAKMAEEVGEVAQAVLEDSDDLYPIVMETLDVIHTCEVLLRRCKSEVVDKAREGVIAKNARRGYYGTDGDAA